MPVFHFLSLLSCLTPVSYPVSPLLLSLVYPHELSCHHFPACTSEKRSCTRNKWTRGRHERRSQLMSPIVTIRFSEKVKGQIECRLYEAEAVFWFVRLAYVSLLEQVFISGLKHSKMSVCHGHDFISSPQGLQWLFVVATSCSKRVCVAVSPSV